MADFEKKEVKKRSDNLSDWYTDITLKAELADYGPAKGTMVIRPYGYSIWERIQKVMNEWMGEYGVENAYFPMFIPHSLLEKEKDHIKGFSPELAVVTHGGGKKLAEPLVVRPTSETIMYHMFSKWVSSHRDLPLLINQWNNVVRWELRTYLFIRTTEFLWQEGHTAHANEEEAVNMQKTALEWYKKIYEEYLAIPAIVGEKSENERFAGAKTTYTVEALMPDGKALQGATSHNLGQNFSKPFDVSFQDENGQTAYAWQTSWGLSTRVMGALFMTHGDDNGLTMPPKIAPVQVVIIPIWKSKKDKILEYSQNIANKLKDQGIRVKIDDRENQSVGRKFNEWEVKGVPLRIEIGEKELLENNLSITRRDNFAKSSLHLNELDQIGSLLDQIQIDLFEKAKKFLDENTRNADNYDEFKKIMKDHRGFIKVYWKENKKDEEKIKEETKATSRAKVMDNKTKGKCFMTGEPTSDIWYFAQSY